MSLKIQEILYLIMLLMLTGNPFIVDGSHSLLNSSQ